MRFPYFQSSSKIHLFVPERKTLILLVKSAIIKIKFISKI
ncbi:hypothetical protein B4125_3977 [Bacillus paralicheniformis]|nr:hypothetical protein B4125_3977 [Bacillus paralicheniformis]TWJ63895.1 hypothetical protein CHCC5022_0025 [Bacillus paralicheniformis]TWJ82699.1 hypothetical protein CHCC4186_4376 [Bacillus paralicheniformis]TWK51686.1 hypothetical protein CHCC20347_2986 [Bacillus paralicheniformis]TWM08675.1 hypothetical protein CHCC15136_1199 [Bacillus paralicheniformis]